jgi:hypothetical protein
MMTPGQPIEQHIVEFWPMAAPDVRLEHHPHQVPCADEAEAIALESKFHAVGWAARAVTLRVQRKYPTAGLSHVKRAA